jgi:transcriptional regulator with XRE-family HTH domain
MTREVKANAEIGRRLRRLRVQRRITLDAAAASLGVSYSTIQRAENGEGLSAARLKELCQLYCARPEDVLRATILVDGEAPDLSIAALKIAMAYDRLDDGPVRKAIDALLQLQTRERNCV